MPAQSKQQQKFMGLVHAIQKGDVPASDASPEAQKVAKDMKPSDVKDFASTKHKGLPKRVKQEILNKLKEYALTLPGHHMKSPAPSVPLRNDRDMDLQTEVGTNDWHFKAIQKLYQKAGSFGRKKIASLITKNPNSSWDKIEKELKGSDYDEVTYYTDMLKLESVVNKMKSVNEDRIPQNFNVGTTQDYHTKLATTPRKKYDKTNFKPQDSGQPDLEDDDVNESFNELEHLKLLNLAMKAMPGSPKQKEIIKKLNQVRIAGGMKPIKESSIIEYASNLDNSYILNKDAEIKEENPCWNGYKQVGMKTKGGKQVPNCVKESVNEAVDVTSLKKIHDAVFKFLKTKKGVGEVREFSEFPNRYGDNVSTFSVKYNIEDKYNYDLQEIKIEYSTSRVFIPNKGYFSFKTFNDIKNIINKKSSLKESVNESSKEDIIKDLDKAKNDLLKKVDVLIAKKKKLYSNVDIESPMSSDEKKLDKDIADLFSQINKLVLQKRNLKEELSFNEREMVVGIIEILKQVEDRKNRMKIALNMLKKFKEEGIEFDYQKFIDHLKEYSMGSYEYDKGNRELGEAMIMQAKDVIYKVVPKSTFARFASDPKKNREFVDSIVRDLTYLLNRFYKQNNIDLVLK